MKLKIYFKIFQHKHNNLLFNKLNNRQTIFNKQLFKIMNQILFNSKKIFIINL
jgi:hypothetical protein